MTYSEFKIQYVPQNKTLLKQWHWPIYFTTFSLIYMKEFWWSLSARCNSCRTAQCYTYKVLQELLHDCHHCMCQEESLPVIPPNKPGLVRNSMPSNHLTHLTISTCTIQGASQARAVAFSVTHGMHLCSHFQLDHDSKTTKLTSACIVMLSKNVLYFLKMYYLSGWLNLNHVWMVNQGTLMIFLIWEVTH